MGSAVAAVACAAWVAAVVALVDVSVSIIVANANSIVSPGLIKRKYQNAHVNTGTDAYIVFEYLCIMILASMYARYQGCRYNFVTVRLIEFFSEHQ